MKQRDVGNEVVVALIAIAMLALSLTFGLVLILSETVVNPTATLSSTSISGVVATQAVSSPSAIVAVLPSKTSTLVLSNTLIPSPTETVTARPAHSVTPATGGVKATTPAASASKTATPTVVRTATGKPANPTQITASSITATTVAASATKTATPTVVHTATGKLANS